MGLVHILLEDGQQPAYEEDQVRAMLLRGELSPATYFWREGMPEWLPLSELPDGAKRSIAPPRRTDGDAAQPTASFSRTSSPIRRDDSPANRPDEAKSGSAPRKQHYWFRVNPIPLTVLLQILYIITLGAASCYVFQCYERIYAGSHFPSSTSQGSVSDPTTDSSLQPRGLSDAEETYFMDFKMPLIALHLVTQILFFVWIYYANKNCRGFVNNLRFTPGWAVGYFFIPILSLFRPYQVVQEIWNVSKNPQTWLGKRDSIFVGFWFLCRLGIGILARGPFHTSYSNSLDFRVQMLGTLSYGAVVEGVLFFIDLTSFLLVSIVTWRQVQWTRS